MHKKVESFGAIFGPKMYEHNGSVEQINDAKETVSERRKQGYCD